MSVESNVSEVDNNYTATTAVGGFGCWTFEEHHVARYTDVQLQTNPQQSLLEQRISFILRRISMVKKASADISIDAAQLPKKRSKAATDAACSLPYVDTAREFP